MVVIHETVLGFLIDLIIKLLGWGLTLPDESVLCSYVCHLVGTKMNMMRPSPLFHQAKLWNACWPATSVLYFHFERYYQVGLWFVILSINKRLLFPIINRSQLLWRQTKKFEDLVSMLKLELDSSTMDMFLVHLGGDTQKISASKQESGSLSKWVHVSVCLLEFNICLHSHFSNPKGWMHTWRCTQGGWLMILTRIHWNGHEWHQKAKFFKHWQQGWAHCIHLPAKDSFDLTLVSWVSGLNLTCHQIMPYHLI